MKHRIPIPTIVVTLFLISGCGGSGGGNDGPAISPNPGTASGRLNVPPGNDLELEPNDSLLQAQAVTTSTTVAGRASDPDSGFQLPSGNRVQDLYRLTVTEPVRIVLTIAEDNHTANDLDLFLLDSGGAVLQVSEARNTGIELLETLDTHYPADVRIRVILDNHSAHTSKETYAWLTTHPGRFEFIFTPKHGSWLNLVEAFFAKMAKSMLRGIRVRSKAELRRRIELWLEEINEQPVIFRWKHGLDALAVTAAS